MYSCIIPFKLVGPCCCSIRTRHDLQVLVWLLLLWVTCCQTGQSVTGWMTAVNFHSQNPVVCEASIVMKRSLRESRPSSRCIDGRITGGQRLTSDHIISRDPIRDRVPPMALGRKISSAKSDPAVLLRSAAPAWLNIQQQI